MSNLDKKLIKHHDKLIKKKYDSIHTDYKLKEFSRSQSIKNMKRAKRADIINRVGFAFRIFGIVIFLILFINVFYKVRSSNNNLNFTGFLDFLSTRTQVAFDLSFPDYTIGGSWGAFDFLKNFFNIFAVAFGAIVWLFKNIFNLFNFIVQFVNFLFS